MRPLPKKPNECRSIIRRFVPPLLPAGATRAPPGCGFIREPEALFWVYGFPIVMTVALGIAFRNQPVEQQYAVDVIENPKAEATQKALISALIIPTDSKLKLFRKMVKRNFICERAKPT